MRCIELCPMRFNVFIHFLVICDFHSSSIFLHGWLNVFFGTLLLPKMFTSFSKISSSPEILQIGTSQHTIWLASQARANIFLKKREGGGGVGKRLEIAGQDCIQFLPVSFVRYSKSKPVHSCTCKCLFGERKLRIQARPRSHYCNKNNLFKMESNDFASV